MVVVAFFMPKLYEEEQHDIVQFANEGRSGDQIYKDISEWERDNLGPYINNFKSTYNKWKMTGDIFDPRTFVPNRPDAIKTLHLPDLKLDNEASPFPIDSNATEQRPFKRVLTLGKKQVEWLQLVVPFYTTFTKAVNESKDGRGAVVANWESTSKSIGEIIENIILDASWRAIDKIDEKELQDEEKELKGTKPAEKKPDAIQNHVTEKA